MRLKSAGGSHLIPEPTMPSGLMELMEDLTRTVLRHNPTELYEYCTNHMAKLIEIRDGRGPIPKLTLEQKIARAQKKMRKKAEQRRREYDMEMLLLRNNTKSADEVQDTEIISEPETIHKTPIHQENEIAHSSELEISHQNNDDSVPTDTGDENRIAAVSVENGFKEDSQINRNEDLKEDTAEAKDVEIVISEIYAKSDESVPPHGLVTTDSTNIFTNSDENQETAVMNIDNYINENNIVGDNNQVKIASVDDSTEIVNNEIMEKISKLEQNIQLDNANKEEIITTTGILDSETYNTKDENDTVEIKEDTYTIVSVKGNQDDSSQEIITTTGIIDSKTYNTKDENDTVEIKEDTDTIVSLKGNQDDSGQENSEIKENTTDLKSDCINESSKIAYNILNVIVNKSEAHVNEMVESKESKIENYGENLNKNEHDYKDPESHANGESLIAKNNLDSVTANDKNGISEVVVTSKNNVKDEINVTDMSNVEETESITNTNKHIKNIYEEPTKGAVVDEVAKQEMQEQNTPNEIPAKMKTAYLCGEEIEEMQADNKINSGTEKAETLNAKDSNAMINVKLTNESRIDDEEIKGSNMKTELSESTTETADKQFTGTIKTPKSVDEKSNVTTSNTQVNKASTPVNSQANSIKNIDNLRPINETVTVKESIENNQCEPLVSNLTDNKSNDINNVQTLEQANESNEIINDSHIEISEDEKVNVAESVSSEISNDSQLTHIITSSKDDSEKTENNDTKVNKQNEEKSYDNNLKQNIEEIEDASNNQLIYHSIGETKLNETMFSNDPNKSISNSDENKTNPDGEKGNEEKLSMVDPMTECETIEITIMENGHKDNDASIEMPQDDTSTIGDSPEHDRNKRTEDEISDIQEISGISDLQQLHTIETNSIRKCSSISDSIIDENSDSNGESDMINKNNDLSQSPSVMDLETAAVTIQKVFRSFMFKSRCSTFDDTGNDDNNSVDEDREDNDYEVTSSKERRPLGISRMDTVTVLQTVNEEKSLSLSTDDSSLSSAATIIQAHVRGFLVRNRLNSSKALSTSLVNSDGQAGQSFETVGEQQTNKTILNIQLVPEGGHYLSRDESVLTSIDLSLDGSPHSSNKLHPLGYDKSEPRKQLKREDAVQSISPPSNNSGKLSEDVDSVKEVLPNDSEQQMFKIAEKKEDRVEDSEEKLDDNSRETTPSKSTTVETVIEVKKVDKDSVESRKENIENDNEIKDNRSVEMNSDEADVVSPFITNGKYSRSDSDNTSGLLHSGEFHDIVLPTKVSRKTSVVRGE